MTIKEKLFRLTEDRKRTVLARRAGLHPTAISDYIQKGCMPSAAVALRLAQVLGVEVEWLIDPAQEWPPKFKTYPDPIRATQSVGAIAA